MRFDFDNFDSEIFSSIQFGQSSGAAGNVAGALNGGGNFDMGRKFDFS
jgi:hypothetical protein